jgi:hypothetical protein
VFIHSTIGEQSRRTRTDDLPNIRKVKYVSNPTSEGIGPVKVLLTNIKKIVISVYS